MAARTTNLDKDPAAEKCEQRLLDAAAEVFAEVGFKDATVREICRRADANVAAVNYHFGDKAQLYSQTLRHLANAASQKYPFGFGVSPTAEGHVRLRAFVESFLMRVFSDDRAALYGRIITREMVEPTHALQERIDETIRPMAELISDIVRQILGKRASDDEIRRGALSVVGQIVFYKHCQPILGALFPGKTVGPAQIQGLTDHITNFSLAGLKAMRERNEQKR